MTFTYDHDDHGVLAVEMENLGADERRCRRAWFSFDRAVDSDGNVVDLSAADQGRLEAMALDVYEQRRGDAAVDAYEAGRM